MHKDTSKNFAAILGMALISVMAITQFRGLLAAESSVASSSTALLTMIAMSGLLALTTVGFTTKLVLTSVRH